MAYDVLFQPIQIGSITVKNRIALAPMEGTAMIDWLMAKGFKDECRDFYIERAKDGIGLMVPGMVPIRSFMKNKWLHKNPGAFDHVKEFMDELHQYGTKVFFQLGIFSGRNFTIMKQLEPLAQSKLKRKMASAMINLDANLVAPDDNLPNVWMPNIPCRALSTSEVEEFVEAYAKSALLCKNAGVDGVEIHAVHEGYLMDQFTLPYTNHRTDKYGGSFENRYRFAVEVVRAIKEACGEDYPVSMRYSVVSKTIGFNTGALPGEEYTEAGRTMEESERAIKLLREAGVDMFNCDNGTYDAWYWAHPPVYMPLNCNLEDVKHIKQFTDAPVYCAGRIQLDAAEEAVGSGALDGVSIGRQFLADEQFLTKAREGRMEDVRPCISCHSACFPLATFKNVGAEVDEKIHYDPRYCALNVRTFAEKLYTPKPTAEPKRFAVIGGGVAGMEFALQMDKRGHSVDLYEKSDRLGGVFIAAAALPFKEKDRELLDWYRHQLEKSSVCIHMNTEVTDLSALEADEIILATGSTPKHLPISGAEKGIAAVDYLMGRASVGNKVAIIGGGLTGCEIAYALALEGKQPFIVEMTDDLIKAYGVCAANSNFLRDAMRCYHVPVYLESAIREIRDGSIVISNSNGEIELEAESVILSVGYNSHTPLHDPENKKLHLLGDASSVGNLRTAIWAANDLAITYK